MKIESSKALVRTAAAASVFFLAALRPPPATAGACQALIEKARRLKLSEEPQWRRLLHFAPGLFGSRSEVRSAAFFLSPRGRRDARAEMEADLRGFFEAGGDPDQHPQCRFPARYAWLKSRLAVPASSLREEDCPRFSRWKEEVSASSVTLVFASAYLNNPSSMYGHTFLRLDKGANGLLDYAVNFAAITTTDNGLLFAAYGLTGVFPGRFSVLPYYLKVQEYNNLESRDIWEYRLSLSSEEIGRLLTHLWELGQADFPYYFLNKNCSYQLLPLLEIARPSLNLTRGWPLYVIPVDTVKAAARRDLVAQRAFRPSLVTTMIQRRRGLSALEAQTAYSLARGRPQEWQKLSALPQGRKAAVLDASLEYLQYITDYRHDSSDAYAGLNRRLLLERSQIRQASPPLQIDPPAPPESGHGSSRAELGYGYAGRLFLEAAWRPGLHDLIDPPDGYAADSELAMAEARLRHDFKEHETYLREFNIVRVLSLSPLDPWMRKPSWTVGFGWRTADEFGGDPAKKGYFGAGGGTGLALEARFLGRDSAYLLLNADGGVGPVFHRGFRLGGGPAAGIVFHWLPRLRSKLEARYFGYGLGDARPAARLRFENAADLSRLLSLRLVLERHGESREISGRLAWYF